MTTKFIKKPIEVEAVQFTDQNKDMVYNWAKSIQANVYHSWDENKIPILKIPTSEGEMICAIGDYLIVEPFPTDWRKLYPCKQSIFEKTYTKNTGPSLSIEFLNWYSGMAIEKILKAYARWQEEKSIENNDNTPLNSSENQHVFLQFGEIKSGGIEDIYHVEGIGSALANENGLFFIGWPGKVVTTLGELKEFYKFATGKKLPLKKLVCDVCGSDDIIEAPHMGKNCNTCHPLN